MFAVLYTRHPQTIHTQHQHSQLQLYLDGPADKLFSLVTCHTANTGRQIPVEMACDIGLEHLGGRRVGDLLDVFSGSILFEDICILVSFRWRRDNLCQFVLWF